MAGAAGRRRTVRANQHSPGRVSTRPSLRRLIIACCTVWPETPYRARRVAFEGRRSPGAYSPERMLLRSSAQGAGSGCGPAWFPTGADWSLLLALPAVPHDVDDGQVGVPVVWADVEVDGPAGGRQSWSTRAR